MLLVRMLKEVEEEVAQNQGHVPQQRRAHESPLPSSAKRLEEMDYARAKLEKSAELVCPVLRC